MKYTPDYKSRFRILKGGKISLVISALLGSVTISFASPVGGTVTSGSASISQSGVTTNITQTTSKATINWQSFGIAQNETVNFIQPSVNAITLNRVVGNERSIIDGALNANGQVWILNSNGILFNSTARINTAGILATTKALSDADFQNGNYTFTGESTASVVNMGEVTITDKGYAALLADTVSNEGTIKAVQGSIVFANGEATINLSGNSLVNLRVDKGVIDSLIENKGALLADGGKIIMTSKAADEILKNTVNNSGIIEAKSFDDMMGEVEIVAEGGYAQNSGTIDVSSDAAIGGKATFTGYHTMITDTGVIHADGATGGGTVQVGGSWQNSDTSVYQAVGTIVQSGAKLTANATDNGDGGTVVAWSDIHNPDSATRAYGTFEANGGVNGGDGGNIEISGHWLDASGADISTLAPKGENGKILFDPYNITINALGYLSWDGQYYTTGYDNTTGNAFSDNAIIKISDLYSWLGSGSVWVYTGTGGSQAGNITVQDTINSDGWSLLQLEAAGNIYINADISVNRNNTQGGVSLKAGGSIFLDAARTVTAGGYGLQISQGTAGTIAGKLVVAGTGQSAYTTFYGNTNVTLSNTGNVLRGIVLQDNAQITLGSDTWTYILEGPSTTKINNGGHLLTSYSYYTSYPSYGQKTFAGIISGSGGLSVQGSYLQLSGANTYTGATTVGASGSLALNHADAISSSSSVTSSGIISVGSGITATVKNLSGSGTHELNLYGNLIANQSGSYTYNANLTSSGSLTINSPSSLSD